MTDSLAWETLDTEVVYRCPGFEVVRERVRLPDGEETDFDYLSDPPSVCVLAFTEHGDVVTIEEWRQAVSGVSRGLPVGGVEPDDEDLEATARRELREETGYEADAVSHLRTIEPANGYADSVVHLFVAHDCRPTATQDLDHDESICVREVGLDSLLEEIRTGTISDGRTVAAVCSYRLFGPDAA